MIFGGTKPLDGNPGQVHCLMCERNYHMMRPETRLRYTLFMCLAAFVLWSFIVFHSHTVMSLDEYFYTLASEGASYPVWISINRYLSFLANGVFLYGLCSVLMVYLVLRGRIREAVWLGVALLIGIRLNELLKIYFSRPRPLAYPAHRMMTSFAYPSGHAFSSLFFYGLALWTLRRVQGRFLQSKWPAWLVLSLVLLIGESRVSLRVHWVSDVIGGFMAGSVWLVFNIMLAEQFHFFGHHRTRK
jgi:membrane-associated phospholipid phosphatase